MTLTVPGNFNVLVLIVLVLLVVMLVFAISRRPAGANDWSLPRVLYCIAFVCFVLAALGVATFPWLPVGLACWTGAILAS